MSQKGIGIILLVINKFPEMTLGKRADVNSGSSGTLKGDTID